MPVYHNYFYLSSASSAGLFVVIWSLYWLSTMLTEFDHVNAFQLKRSNYF